DRSRSTEEAIQVIEEGMRWLGLNWDEGPFRQTDRLDLYRQHADRLFKEGKAYWCDCSPEQLEARRAEALKKGLTPKSHGRCRDHLNNTPRQMHLYHAFGYSPPKFAHLSMILGPDKARLSKRHGATSVLAYREMGYLPEALVNYLSRLSWSSGDQEIFSLQE